MKFLTRIKRWLWLNTRQTQRTGGALMARENEDLKRVSARLIKENVRKDGVIQELNAKIAMLEFRCCAVDR